MSPVLDRYLADGGIEAQQDEKPVEPDRKDNLFEPVPGDHGAHGRFDERRGRVAACSGRASIARLLAGGAALAAGAAAVLREAKKAATRDERG